MALDGERRVDGVLQVLGHPASFGVPLAAGSSDGSTAAARRLEAVMPSPDVLRDWPRRPDLPPDRESRLGPPVLEALETLAAAKETRRRTALCLLELAASWNVLAAWEGWWREVARLEPERDRLHGLGRNLRAGDRARLAALVTRLAEILAEMPPEVDTAALVRASLDATFADDARLAGSVARALELLPEEEGRLLPRASFLLSWSAWPRKKLSVLRRLARGLELHLARDSTPAALAPWRGLFERMPAHPRATGGCPDELFRLGTLDAELVEPLFEALRLAVSRASLARALESNPGRDLVLEALGNLVSVLRDPSRAVEHIHAVLEERSAAERTRNPFGSLEYLADPSDGVDLTRYLDRLASGEPAVFAGLLERSRKGLESSSHLEYLLATERLRRPSEIRQAILAGGIRRVHRLGLAARGPRVLRRRRGAGDDPRSPTGPSRG